MTAPITITRRPARTTTARAPTPGPTTAPPRWRCLQVQRLCRLLRRAGPACQHDPRAAGLAEVLSLQPATRTVAPFLTGGPERPPRTVLA
ncbi:hypothetical protein FSC37_07400 [Piscinibacter aquaticus]|uniref:Uncharacterized protein n=1 Tax=Piscinibacter aquaticus TaxID=392597 RepID=A0A5C6TZ41_9BURK|nr:hypothetical protein FSC37_07400 [Piscinibacter aquaticus]